VLISKLLVSMCCLQHAYLSLEILACILSSHIQDRTKLREIKVFNNACIFIDILRFGILKSQVVLIRKI
jgi:hypothetical protein